MFSLAISCLTRSYLPWFTYLTFHVPTQYCSLQHQTLLSPPGITMAEHHFCFGPVTSFFLEHFIIALHSSLVAYWAPSDLGNSSSSIILFALSYCLWGSHGKNTGVGCHSLFQWTTFCHNSPLWPVQPGWPWTMWLITFLSYVSPFAMTRQWSTKGISFLAGCCFLFFNWKTIAWQCLLVSAVCHRESDISIHISSPSWVSLPPHPHSTSLGYHRALNWVPCVIRQLPTS